MGNAGSERIEELDSPWGFNWNRKVTYTYTNLFQAGIWNLIARLVRLFNNAEGYVDINYNLGKGTSTIVIHYDYFNKLGNIASSPDDGFKNTSELKSYKNISAGVDLERYFDQWVASNWYSKDSIGGIYNLSNFAVKNALMKNRFYKELKHGTTTDGKPVDIEVPILHQEDFVWFLPASNEYTQIKDTEYPLNGVYWTSTAIPNSSSTYIYTATNNVGTISTEGVRMQTHKIRAMRKK